MSLPDATRSDRIYPLLQNLDLENLAFATLQGTGETLNIEEMNEDELRRLVLVNLARLTVKGEWNGLLSAGGGGGQAVTLIPYSSSAYSVDYMELLHTSAPWGVTNNAASNLGTDLLLWPFVASNSAALSSMSIYVSYSPGGTCTVQVGIYSDDDGTPKDLIGYGTFDCSSSGMKTQTSFSSTITLVAGTQYWYSYLSTSTNVPNLERTDEGGLPTLGVGADNGLYLAGRGTSVDANVQTQDATITLSGITITDMGRMSLGVKY